MCSIFCCPIIIILSVASSSSPTVTVIMSLHLSVTYRLILVYCCLFYTASLQRIVNMESAVNEKLEVILKTLKGVQDQQKDDYKKTEKRLLAFEKSMDFINSQFENYKKITDRLMKRNTKLETENKELRNRIDKMEGKLNTVASDVNDLEQYGRRDCLEINGIPKEENECPESVIIKLGEKIGVKCDANEIHACHCIGPKFNAGIICKFTNRKVRDQVIKNKKEAKHVSGKDLDLQATNVKIFINKSLTRKTSTCLN